MLEQIKPILEDLLPELNSITIKYMVDSGISPQSNLVKSVGFETNNKGIDLEANYYWTYASEGRRARTRKVPITALIDYIKRYNIRPRAGQSINQLAFAIQTSIYKQGINPKNYLNKVIDATSDLTEETVADEVIELVADDVVKTMTSTPYAKEI